MKPDPGKGGTSGEPRGVWREPCRNRSFPFACRDRARRCAGRLWQAARPFAGSDPRQASRLSLDNPGGQDAADQSVKGERAAIPQAKVTLTKAARCRNRARSGPQKARSAASIPDLSAPLRRQGLPAPPKADRPTRVIPQHDRDVPARLKAERRPADRGGCRPAPGTGGAGISPGGPQRPPLNGGIPQIGAAARHGLAGGMPPSPQFLGTCRPCTYWPSCTSRTGVGVAMPSPLSNRTRLPSSSGANLGITRPSSCA